MSELRPRDIAPTDHAPFYARYLQRLPPDRPVLALLREQAEETAARLRPLDEQRADLAYAPGKWTVREVAGHLADCERIFGYRALRIARADETPLASFDEDRFVAAAHFERRPLADILAELAHLRAANLLMFEGLDAQELARAGTASGARVTVAALAAIIAGHERHHLSILRERYGV